MNNWIKSSPKSMAGMIYWNKQNKCHFSEATQPNQASTPSITVWFIVQYDIYIIHQSKEHGKLVIVVRCHICLASVSSCYDYLHYLVDLEEHQILSPTQFAGIKIRATSVTFHGIYMGSRGNYFIIGVSYAPMGHLRMWRVQLS